MPLMIGKGSIVLNHRRVLDGQYHIVQTAMDGQSSAWSGYFEVSGQTRDGLTEAFRWLGAGPSGLWLGVENGGKLPVSRLNRESFDFAAGEARFAIVFAAAEEE
jgi:hypothetical protein